MSLRVPMFVAKSKLHGMGLFAARPIKKGTVVWMWSPAVDTVDVEPDDLERDYSWVWGGRWHMPGDDARYINHADEPNLMDDPDPNVDKLLAARDIAAGEELTENYGYDESLQEKP